jgi:hypothetical protein
VVDSPTTTIQITLEVTRNGATADHLIRFLNKRLRRAMEDARFYSAAGPRLENMTIEEAKPKKSRTKKD